MRDTWINATEAAELLGVSRAHVYTLIHRRQLTVRKTGVAVEVSRRSVERRKAENKGPGQPRKVPVAKLRSLATKYKPSPAIIDEPNEF